MNRGVGTGGGAISGVLGVASRATEWIAVGGLATTSESVVGLRTPPPSTSVFTIKRWSASGLRKTNALCLRRPTRHND